MNKKINILLVDDEANFRDLMSFWLKSRGYDVTVLPDGKSAIERIRKDCPDILFLDLRMPGMDGEETLKKIREFNTTLPVIIISAHLDERGAHLTSYNISGIFYKNKNFEDALPLLESVLHAQKRLKKKT